MPSMNQVCLIGKVTQDPSVRELKGGMKLATFGIGIPESKKKDGEWVTRHHFVDIVAWDQTAEIAHEKLKKGEFVSVVGNLQFEQWEKDGKKNSKLKVRAQRLQRLPKETPVEEPAPF